MAKHHDYKQTNTRYTITPTGNSYATGWSSATENLGKAYDYLASLTMTVEEEVSCLSRHYHGLRDMAHQRRLINAKTFVSTTKSRATQTRVRVKVVSH